MFISIADDPGGNEICICVVGEYIGKIYFWFHDGENSEEMDNMYFLKDSFNDLY